ncbi:TPA: hypothetical protein DEP94_02305 [Candidatus Nomurabacteria bacterium]|nr:hypothetical protein [Candidatus Nomurabacteria bacterium]
MTKKLWFRAKTYGWGWTPSTWEGWLVTTVAILFIILDSLRIDKNSEDIPYFFFIRMFLIISILLFICYKKGEKPGWRWGGGSN